MIGYLTFTQAGGYLGFTGKHRGNTARKWAERRGVPRYWRGRAWVVKAADLDAALEGGRGHVDGSGGERRLPGRSDLDSGRVREAGVSQAGMTQNGPRL